MQNNYAPTRIQKIQDNYVLWFENSNRYVIVDDFNYKLLNLFLTSTSKNQFIAELTQLDFLNKEEPEAIYNSLNEFLLSCHKKHPKNVEPATVLDKTKKYLSEYYYIYEKAIIINYDSELSKSLIHPSYAHLSSKELKGVSSSVFHIEQRGNYLYLFKNGMLCEAYNTVDYHLLQGKFAIELLCALTDTSEADWMATFHATTIANDTQAIMLVGASGQGKSTLTALLTQNGFDLVADDFTPMLDSQLICSYPAAISIKSGAFDIVKSYYANFATLPISNLRANKGPIKYIWPPDTLSKYRTYSCKNIVSVHYKEGAKTQFKRNSAEKVLNILIPDSWISPDKTHAKQFLDWLCNINYYELTYSNHRDVGDLFTKVLKT